MQPLVLLLKVRGHCAHFRILETLSQMIEEEQLAGGPASITLDLPLPPHPIEVAAADGCRQPPLERLPVLRMIKAFVVHRTPSATRGTGQPKIFRMAYRSHPARH